MSKAKSGKPIAVMDGYYSDQGRNPLVKQGWNEPWKPGVIPQGGMIRVNQPHDQKSKGYHDGWLGVEKPKDRGTQTSIKATTKG